MSGKRLTSRNSLALPVALPVVVPATKFLAWMGLQNDERIGIRTEKRKKEVRVIGFALGVGPWTYELRPDGRSPFQPG